MNTIQTAAAVAAVVGLVAAFGQSDYEAAVADARYYTEMVCAGHWPDYDNRKPNCGAITLARVTK